jgi:hypothetical protein
LGLGSRTLVSCTWVHNSFFFFFLAPLKFFIVKRVGLSGLLLGALYKQGDSSHLLFLFLF